MNRDSPRSLLGSTDSSSDDESIFSDASIDGEQLETGAALPISDNTWNRETPSPTTGFILVDESQSFFNGTVRDMDDEKTIIETSIVPEKQSDEPTTTLAEYISPSDEEAFQEQGGFSDDKWLDDTDDEDLTSDSMKERLSSKRRYDEISTTSIGTKNLHTFKLKKTVKPCATGKFASASLGSPVDFSSKLKNEIEAQKAKSTKYFLEWKVELPKLIANQHTLLSQVFGVKLNSLKEGEHWFGSDFIICNDESPVPIDPVFVGAIISEGCAGKKYLLLIGRKKEELNIGFSDAVTDLLTIKVHDDGTLAMYNKAKPAFQIVCAGPPDLFFDYNPDMVFVGCITSDRKFKVNILGQDEVYEMDVFPTGCQIFYTDHLSKLQNIYSSRVVVLEVISENVALMNFNYSYPCFIQGKYQPKFIDFFIPAGANPDYF